MKKKSKRWCKDPASPYWVYTDDARAFRLGHDVPHDTPVVHWLRRGSARERERNPVFVNVTKRGYYASLRYTSMRWVGPFKTEKLAKNVALYLTLPV